MLRNHRRGDKAGFRRKDRAQIADPEAAPEGEDDFGNLHSPKPQPPQRRGLPRVLRGR